MWRRHPTEFLPSSQLTRDANDMYEQLSMALLAEEEHLSPKILGILHDAEATQHQEVGEAGWKVLAQVRALGRGAAMDRYRVLRGDRRRLFTRAREGLVDIHRHGGNRTPIRVAPLSPKARADTELLRFWA